MNTVVFLLSAGILACEVVLMRMFSIAQWHHFAAMIISVALLGFGVSGAILSLWQAKLLARFRLVFASAALAFVFAVPVSTWLALRTPLNLFQIIWQIECAGALLRVYLLLLVPFLAGAFAIGLALAQARATGNVGRTYAFNLLGSGLGAALGLALCFLPWPVRMSEFKQLSIARVMGRTTTAWTRHHPLGRVDLLDSSAFRVAPGLSLNYRGEFPRHRVMFTDGDSASPVIQTHRQDPSLAYLDWLPTAVAYQAVNAQRALVIGVGGGSELLQALRTGVPHVTGIEMHPVIAAVARETLPEADVITADGRAWLRRNQQRFDVIQISPLDSATAAATGAGAANEDYLFTVESFVECLRHLTDTGVLAATRRVRIPPRDTVKLIALAVEALERAGVREPANSMMFVRGWATGTVLMKNTPFNAAEIARVRAWADARLFDVDWFPGATAADANRFNVMERPAHFDAVRAVLGPQREAFYRDFPFNVRPSTDDRPYFAHYFRWKAAGYTLGKMLHDRTRISEWGYILSLATLGQAAFLSLALLVWPVIVARRRAVAGRWRFVFVYFACLGLGFMFLEMVLLQKFTLFLGHPLYSAATVIASFLIFAGVGSWLTGHRITGAHRPAMMIVVFAMAYPFALPAVFGIFLGTPAPLRLVLSLLLLAPPALFMGMMFPLGLARIPSGHVPLAWAVNGCFSVIGVVLAGVLAMDFGFSIVFLAAAVFYAISLAVWPGLRP